MIKSTIIKPSKITPSNTTLSKPEGLKQQVASLYKQNNVTNGKMLSSDIKVDNTNRIKQRKTKF